MSATQQTEKISFGTARVFIQPLGSTVLQSYGDVQDAQFDIKYEQKPVWGEGAFPIAVFDGHRSIDISVKGLRMDLTTIATDLNQAAPIASTGDWIVDEKGTIATHAYTLVNGATYVAGSLFLRVLLAGTGGVLYPVTYAIVTAGSEVAGKSASVSGSGVITFAVGETATTCYATYEYTLATGTQIAIVNAFQGSAPAYKVLVVKRDTSLIDNSVGTTFLTFNSCRFGGIKWGYTEDKETTYERSLMAFADPTGNVGSMSFTNH